MKQFILVLFYVLIMESGVAQQACIIISAPAPLEVQCIKVEISQRGANDGSISALVVGGVGTYSYQWSNGATISQINQLGAGSYAVTVTDANGCKSICQTTLVEPPCQLDAGQDQVLTCNGSTVGTTTTLFPAAIWQNWQLLSQPVGATAQITNAGVITGLTKIGDYIFELSLINDITCKDSVKITVPNCSPPCPPRICVGVVSTRKL